jgi:acyl-CoA synthetase (AMP-forming)/AMP-acid ligase II
MGVSMNSAAELLKQDFATVSDLIRAHAAERPTSIALINGSERLDYAQLERLIDRVAVGLQRDRVQPGDVVAICAATSIEYCMVFLGALRVGVAVAPLPPSSAPESIVSMTDDCDAKVFFLDAVTVEALRRVQLPRRHTRVALDGVASAERSLREWMAPSGITPQSVTVDPTGIFNIIYSSGTTGEPKGIAHSHMMRWRQIARLSTTVGYGPNTVTVVSTPLYSNTTLVSFLPTIAAGGTAVLMEKFDPVGFLKLAEQYRATHAMLVPVQYRRIMAVPDFDRYDLSSFVMKTSTSAPFDAALKADVLKRWPGGLTEVYGLTEGGVACILPAHQHPDKLHTVGRPAPGTEIKLIDDVGREVTGGQVGEVVGHSPIMMNGYYGRPESTAEAEWIDADGKRFIRSGDFGRFDEDGFLILMDRKKDMIISGGFNIYPSDLEAVLSRHEAVAEAAVVGVPSERWGETPVAYVVLKSGRTQPPEVLRAWVNDKVGKTQRLAAVEVVPSLPRSAIGKVIKRELRERYVRDKAMVS